MTADELDLRPRLRRPTLERKRNIRHPDRRAAAAVGDSGREVASGTGGFTLSA